jgi:hypothetical protein
MDDKTSFLVRLLARQDALLLPDPGEPMDRANARFQHARQWRETGLPYRGDELLPGAGAKHAARVLTALQNDNLVVAGGANGRRLTVRTTQAGHELGRNLTGLLADAWSVFPLFEKLRPELAGHEANGRPWWVVTRLLPDWRPDFLWGLGAEWIELEVDPRGNLLLGLRPEAHKITKRPRHVFLAEEDPEAVALYEQTYGAAVSELVDLEALNPRDCHIRFLKPYSEWSAAR